MTELMAVVVGSGILLVMLYDWNRRRPKRNDDGTVLAFFDGLTDSVDLTSASDSGGDGGGGDCGGGDAGGDCGGGDFGSGS